MTSYWNGLNSMPWAVCPQCGTTYVGQHNCSTRPVSSDPFWRLPDADVERIAQRVVDLLRQKRWTEQ